MKKEKRIATGVNRLENKIKKNEITATKADKGNTTVLLKKNDYITKVEKFISEGPYEEIKYDYTNKFQAMVKRLIKEISFINEYKKKYSLESNPSAPKYKCQVKIHKEDQEDQLFRLLMHHLINYLKNK